MDIKALGLFIRIAARGSFAAVARDEGLDPSSVSRTIAQLETHLGVRLFQRSTRRLSLSVQGAAFLERISPLVQALSEAEEEARSLSSAPAGTVRISASVAFAQAWLAPRLAGLCAAYPRLGLDLRLDDMNVDLVAERIDIAIRLAPAVHADLIGVKLIDTRYRVCASPHYLGRAPRLHTPADLGAHRCLRFNLPDFRDRWLFRTPAGAVTAVAVGGDVLVSNALALKACSMAAMGPALLPDWLVDADIASGTLIDCFPDFEVAATRFETAAWLLYPSRSFLPAKTRAVLDYLRASA
jgi:DNA-binding transcriptional LysR family regulator